MKYLRSYRIFEADYDMDDPDFLKMVEVDWGDFEKRQNEASGIITDTLSDLSDDGFSINIENHDFLLLNINKLITENGRVTTSGYKLRDIMSDINEMISQLQGICKIKSIYYHIKGYETNTWYDLTDFNYIPDENIDQLTIEFDY